MATPSEMIVLIDAAIEHCFTNPAEAIKGEYSNGDMILKYRNLDELKKMREFYSSTLDTEEAPAPKNNAYQGICIRRQSTGRRKR